MLNASRRVRVELYLYTRQLHKRFQPITDSRPEADTAGRPFGVQEQPSVLTV
jgi:hypothetical protein